MQSDGTGVLQAWGVTVKHKIDTAALDRLVIGQDHKNVLLPVRVRFV